MIPYASSRRLYEPDSSIADLILRAGQQQAEGQRRGGEIWGGLAQNLGQLASGTIRDIAERKRLAPIEAAEQKARTDRNELTGIQLAGARSEQGATTAASEAMKSGGSRASVLAELSSNPDALAKAEAYYERADARSNAQHADSAMQLIESGFDPFVVKGLAADMEERGYDKKVIQQYEMMAKGDPRKAEQFFSGVVSRSKDPAAQAWLTRRTSTQNASLEAEDRKSAAAALLARTKVDDDRAQQTEDRAQRAQDIQQQQFGITRAETQRHNQAVENQKGEGKPPTGVERKITSYFGRMMQADKELQEKESLLPKTLAGQTRMEYAPNFLQSDVGQAYRTAQNQFTEARLRKDSGAAVPPHEYVADRVAYFPQPGDTEATRAQKNRARAALLANVARESGRGLREEFGDDTDALIQSYRDRASSKKGAPLEKGTTVKAPPPQMVKYQGKTVPFSSLPPAVQAQVLELQDK